MQATGSPDHTNLQRDDSLLAALQRTLELIASDAPLNSVLENLCDGIDAQDQQMMSTVLLMDPGGQQLWPAAGRRVPSGWTRAITPLPVTACMGSCGTAAFTKQTVIISDIATDPLFSAEAEPYRPIALSHGLRASWSVPLLSSNQDVLGTFALYYTDVRRPAPDSVQLLEKAASIALIAIERDRSRVALQDAFEAVARSEGNLRNIIDTIPVQAWRGLPDGSIDFFNQQWLDYTGISPQDAYGWGWKNSRSSRRSAARHGEMAVCHSAFGTTGRARSAIAAIRRRVPVVSETRATGAR